MGNKAEIKESKKVLNSFVHFCNEDVLKFSHTAQKDTKFCSVFPFSVGTVGKGTGIMFLNEVALGKSQIVKQNQSHLKAAPAGYDSVLAIGCTEPGRYSRQP